MVSFLGWYRSEKISMVPRRIVSGQKWRSRLKIRQNKKKTFIGGIRSDCDTWFRAEMRGHACLMLFRVRVRTRIRVRSPSKLWIRIRPKLKNFVRVHVRVLIWNSQKSYARTRVHFGLELMFEFVSVSFHLWSRVESFKKALWLVPIVAVITYDKQLRQNISIKL